MSRMSTVGKQNSLTWSNLHARLRTSPFDYGRLFPQQVRSYFKDIASSISTCEGYLVDSVLATTAYVISETSDVRYNGMTTKANLYILFVGPPSTGKSQAIQVGATAPLHAISLARDHANSLIIGKSTSAGLFQRLSQGNGMLINSEIHDVMLKMAKNDGENASGDIATLCHIFSGEKVSTTYATQNKREIDEGRAFSILGATQPGPAAHLLTALDVGNGFIERLIVHVPDCLRPSPSATREARQRITDKPSITHVIQIVESLHEAGVSYTFADNCEAELEKINESYIESINQAIVDGETPPQSKKIDLVVRMAAPIHVLSSVVNALLEGIQPAPPARQIEKESLDAALAYVEYVESQKETFLTELREITTTSTTPVKEQPSPSRVAASVLKTPGPVLTYRSYKSTCSRTMRSVSSLEFRKALENLEPAGELISIRSSNNSKKSEVFVKKDADDIDWEAFKTVNFEEYRAAYIRKLPKCITQQMKQALIASGKCSEEKLN